MMVISPLISSLDWNVAPGQRLSLPFALKVEGAPDPGGGATMTKTCHQCGSTELTELDAEVAIRCDKDTQVYTFGKATLCSRCGFAEYLIPEAALAQLRQRRGGNGHFPRQS